MNKYIWWQRSYIRYDIALIYFKDVKKIKKCDIKIKVL